MLIVTFLIKMRKKTAYSFVGYDFKKKINILNDQEHKSL
jgi:hypothetical protein